MDKWPAARLSTVAPARQLPTAPTPPHNHAPKGGSKRFCSQAIGKRIEVANGWINSVAGMAQTKHRSLSRVR